MPKVLVSRLPQPQDSQRGVGRITAYFIKSQLKRSALKGATVKITVEIDTEIPEGVSDDVALTVKWTSFTQDPK